MMKWQLNPQVVTRRLGPVSVLVNLTSNEVYQLNDTGARVLELLVSGLDDIELAGALGQEFDGSADTIETDVRHVLTDLQGAGMIVPAHA